MPLKIADTPNIVSSDTAFEELVGRNPELKKLYEEASGQKFGLSSVEPAQWKKTTVDKVVVEHALEESKLRVSFGKYQGRRIPVRPLKSTDNPENQDQTEPGQVLESGSEFFFVPKRRNGDEDPSSSSA